MDQRFNIRPETMKLLEEKLRQELYYIRFSNGFLDGNTKGKGNKRRK